MTVWLHGVSVRAIARRARFPEDATQAALDHLVDAGTLVRAEDGVYGFPNLAGWQDSPEAQKKRRQRGGARAKLPWMKVWDSWWKSDSHEDLDGVDLAVGLAAMKMAHTLWAKGDCPGTVPGQSSDSLAGVPPLSGSRPAQRREEQRREEKRGEPPPERFENEEAPCSGGGGVEVEPVEVSAAIYDYTNILGPAGWATPKRVTRTLQWSVMRATDPARGADLATDRATWRAALERLRDKSPSLADGTRGIDWLLRDNGDVIRKVLEGQHDDRQRPSERRSRGRRQTRTPEQMRRDRARREDHTR